MRTWALRAVLIVAVCAALGALVLPLFGSYDRVGGAFFGGILQAGIQVTVRLLGRIEDRRESGL